MQKEWLKQQYIDLNRKVLDIANECNVNVITIGRWRKNFGIPSRKFPAETIAKMSLGRIGKNTNENNNNWKGNDVSYKCLHDWVRKRKSKPDVCDHCGKKKKYLELANISGEYKRDVNDYEYLCVKCHKEKDGVLQKWIDAGKATRFKKGHESWNNNIPSELQPNFGRKHSQESIEKMKAIKKEYWKKRKAKEGSNEIGDIQKTIEVYNN